jgi:hypothetical protein
MTGALLQHRYIADKDMKPEEFSAALKQLSVDASPVPF